MSLRDIVLTFSTVALIAGCGAPKNEVLTPRPSDRAVDHALHEDVVFVPSHLRGEDVRLETTFYEPETKPPWPVVVFNHGSNGRLKSHHLQARERPAALASFFLARGYLVVAPMREGFADSEGECVFACDHANYALRYAGDIQAAVDFFVQRGSARRDQVLVVGQSNGGMVTLGYGADKPQARGIINISGGIDTTRPTCDWRRGMIEAARTLGARTKIPSLWLYADDDATFPPLVSRPFFDAYRTAGAPATFVSYPRGGHAFALHKGGDALWGADVTRFLVGIGMPSEVLPKGP